MHTWQICSKHASLCEADQSPQVGKSDDTTPLMIAADHGHIEVVELLLKKGCSPNTQDRLGRTPLWEAAWNGLATVAMVLLQH